MSVTPVLSIMRHAATRLDVAADSLRARAVEYRDAASELREARNRVEGVIAAAAACTRACGPEQLARLRAALAQVGAL